MEKRNKGTIYENLMADFLIHHQCECVLLECKPHSSNAQSLQTVLRHPKKNHVYHAIKCGDYNVGRNDALLTIPLYMAFLLDLAPEELVLAPIDTDQLTQLAKQALTDR